MRFLLRLPVIRALHRRQLLFPAAVVLVVIGVLAQGSLERDPPVQAVQETTFERPVPLVRPAIRADLEKTPLTYQSDYWNQLARQARAGLVTVGPSETPAIMVGPRLALTTVGPAIDVEQARRRARLTSPDPEPATVDDDAGERQTGEGVLAGPLREGGSLVEPPEVIDEEMGDVEAFLGEALEVDETGPYRLRAWDRDIGLALFDVRGSSDAAFILGEPRELPTGSYLGAVTLDSNGQLTVIPGYLVSTLTDADAAGGSDLVVAMDLPSTLSIAAVVNLDGALVGVAYAHPSGPRVITTTRMLGLMDALETETVCRGLELSDLSDEVRELLEVEGGVLVEYIEPGVFAPPPSLRAGDLLFDWGGEEITSAEQFEEVYDAQEPGSLVSYRAMRGNRRVTGGTVMPGRDCGPLPVEPLRLPFYGLAVQWVTDTEDGPGWRVAAVAPDGPSANAGVEEGDRVLSVDGRAVDDEQDGRAFQALIDSDQAFLMTLARGGRTKLVAVLPPPEPDEALEDDVDASTGAVQGGVDP